MLKQELISNNQKMKRLFTVSFMLFTLLLQGQNLSIAEYYIDTDPGYGNGTPISLSDSIDFIDEVIINDLAIGLHTIGLRIKNSDNEWGLEETVTFIVREQTIIPEPSEITNAEYFFNHDPGYGLATPLTFLSGDTIFIDELITEVLNLGINTLSLRFQNEDGVWGLDEMVRFIIRKDLSISGLGDQISGFEYFIDGDPGVGSGEYIDIENGDTLIFEEWIESQNLTDGIHQFSIRLQSDSGVWSLSEWLEFDYLNCNGDPINVEGEEEFCEGDTVQLSLENTYDTWYWNTHENTSIIDATEAGLYYGNAYDSIANICYLSDTLSLVMFTQPDASFSVTSSFNSIDLSANGSIQDLFWQLNDEFSSIEESFSYSFLNDGWQSICLEASNVCGSVEECDTIILCADFESAPYFYLDNDGDGFGMLTDSIKACSTPEGYADNFLDCNDNDELIYPGANEIPNDGIDQDCDGLDLVTNIGEIDESLFSFYPNPATNQITIEFESTFSGDVEIFDLRGKRINSWTIDNKDDTQLNLENLLPGLYLLQLTKQNIKLTKPLVIQ